MALASWKLQLGWKEEQTCQMYNKSQNPPSQLAKAKYLDLKPSGPINSKPRNHIQHELEHAWKPINTRASKEPPSLNPSTPAPKNLSDRQTRGLASDMSPPTCGRPCSPPWLAEPALHYLHRQQLHEQRLDAWMVDVEPWWLEAFRSFQWYGVVLSVFAV